MVLQMAVFHSFYGCVIVQYTHTHYIFLIQSSASGHLDCFHVLAIINSAALNTEMFVSFGMTVLFSFFFPDIHTGVELLSHMVVSFLAFVLFCLTYFTKLNIL